MTTIIYYSFPDLDVIDYEFVIYHTFRDIASYEYKNIHGEELPEVLITNEEKEFYEHYEDLWWHNKIDEIQYYSFDFDFIDYLKDKYYNDAHELCENELQCRESYLENLSFSWRLDEDDQY